MKTFGEASALIASHVAPLEIETVPLSAGAGRVLAADIRAAIPSPRHSVSAMDGYAVRESDIAGSEPVQVAGEARPGAPFASVLPAGEGKVPRDVRCRQPVITRPCNPRPQTAIVDALQRQLDAARQRWGRCSCYPCYLTTLVAPRSL